MVMITNANGTITNIPTSSHRSSCECSKEKSAEEVLFGRAGADGIASADDELNPKFSAEKREADIAKYNEADSKKTTGMFGAVTGGFAVLGGATVLGTVALMGELTAGVVLGAVAAPIVVGGALIYAGCKYFEKGQKEQDGLASEYKETRLKAEEQLNAKYKEEITAKNSKP